jgi:hypothetical protein
MEANLNFIKREHYYFHNFPIHSKNIIFHYYFYKFYVLFQQIVLFFSYKPFKYYNNNHYLN